MVWILAAVALLAGCARATATPATPATPTAQRLRITNQSGVDIHNLVVIFPDERIVFGDIAAGATSEFKAFQKGVYRYAAYNVEINGRKYSQPVVDWVGEKPMQGQDFTYIVRADPSMWVTKNQVIELLQVVAEP